MRIRDARASWMGLLMLAWVRCSAYDPTLLKWRGAIAAPPPDAAGSEPADSSAGDSQPPMAAAQQDPPDAATDPGIDAQTDSGKYAERDARADAGRDAGRDAPTDAGNDAVTSSEMDAHTESGSAPASDAEQDSASPEAGSAPASDAEQAAATEAGPEAGNDSASDAATDTGTTCSSSECPPVDCSVDVEKCGLGYTPSNFDADRVVFAAAPATTLDCAATTTIDTSGSVTIAGWCGAAPVPVIQNQSDGPELAILPLRGLTIAAGAMLRVIGTRPLVLAVHGAVAIEGTIDASASAKAPGAGGHWSCGTSAGAPGSGQCAYQTGGSGGGGGGFGTPGGQGGSANVEGFPWIDPGNPTGGIGGAARGSDTLTPLLGGCPGGSGGGDIDVPGGGPSGGALQLSASGSLTVHGILRANGGNGSVGCGLTGSGEGGGSGGGSGGAILLEAPSIDVGSATIEANGGAAGEGNCACLPPFGGVGATSFLVAGGAGGGSTGGGGGGGGGYGRVVLHTVR